jgi:putative FmdB family regulatory protein
MPIYEYKCPACGDVFEQMRPMSQATNPAPCPSCKTESPRTVSRLARAGAGSSGGEGGADDLGFGGSDFGGGDFGGGHGHDHGAPGHSH